MLHGQAGSIVIACTDGFSTMNWRRDLVPPKTWLADWYPEGRAVTSTVASTFEGLSSVLLSIGTQVVSGLDAEVLTLTEHRSRC
jgi:hypothetical protein